MIRRAADMRTEVREHMRGGDGSVTIRHCFEPGEFKAPTRLCARLVLPPGASIGTHEHATEDEVYVILGGAGVLDDGVTHTRVQTGDAVLTGQGASHAIRNDGNVDLEIMAMIVCYPK